MPDPLVILLDQNIPPAIASWLRTLRPAWLIHHVGEVGLRGALDRQVFDWAQERRALIITFDEDFADQRSFPVGKHAGVVRLRVWPTTVEETQAALARLFTETTPEELSGALVIIDPGRIRIRRA